MRSMTPTVCFASRLGRTRAAPVDTGISRRAALDTAALPPQTARALAEALPFLRCGEESAVHAFGRRLAGAGGLAQQAALDRITADEERHASWLEALASSLPMPAAAPDAAAMAGFFRRLLTRDPALHFARIAALDLAVCAILRPLASADGALAAAPVVVKGLGSIRRDEARHVRIARRCAEALGFREHEQHALDAAMRAELTRLLAAVAPGLAHLGFVGFGASHDAH
jgi:rubrerythrin